MYPLKFENLYYPKIWGGRDFEIFRDNFEQGNIGESWDVACHKNGTSVVANGSFKGMNLEALIKEKKEALVGTKISLDKFPLLVKLINARDKLSVQVHPNDEYAHRVEGELGKTEVWYVIEALEGANLIVGTKEGCTKDDLKQAIEKGELEKHLNKIYVKKGDVYFVQSGLIHAIGEGVVIAEIQQNSDTTYRLYDYNRGREIHIKKGLEVVNLDLKGQRVEGKKISYDGFCKTELCKCKDFVLEKFEIHSQMEEESDVERFYIYTCIEGKGQIAYDKGVVELAKGDSILIPATLGKYKIKGNLQILKSYVPELGK
ncbi:type I phosphomannose isomerase catalytic subunit [Abyssisolibacter fermentans]|uniref:type I phosphomannose isomerase catalytic subunit n=1 Tax=Abyssisolibacter fermentans TaxID=1766203 RepID=UPI000833C77F|nr:type I phosphomannose isomerase catalytic subunit [Abyssisolibacter fermentans]